MNTLRRQQKRSCRRIGGAKTLLTETGLIRPILEEWDEEVRTKGELKSDNLVLFERNYTQVDLKSSNPIAEESRLESIQVTISLCSLYVKESAIKAKTVQTQQCQSSSFWKLEDNMEKLVAGFSMVLARTKPDQTSSSDVQPKAGNASEQVVKRPCLLRTRFCNNQHTTAPIVFKCILSPHSYVCTQHTSLFCSFATSLLFIPIVDMILSDCHWLRCLAASVRAATSIRRKGWRQRHTSQPFNCAIQRACTLQHAQVHLQYVFGAFAPLTLFTGYEPKNPLQWLAREKMIRNGHATTIPAGGNLTRSLVSSTTAYTDRIRHREATLR